MFYDTGHAEQMFYRRSGPEGQEETVMAMQQIQPVDVEVSAHWRTGAPTALRFAGIERAVTRLLAVRREHGVYLAATGPRTLFELETEDATLVVSFARRSRTWRIEAFDDSWRTLPFASTVEVAGGVLVGA
ncbi:MAG: hypothetical protein DWI45_04100 [Chloroflexi bacterium]|nr:MAG: hypothetical protein DWI45_04100 [Chloroflexota bacterium]